MANIIEKEIEKRKEQIAHIEEDRARLQELAEEFERVKKEIESCDVDLINKEIEELEAYLPHPAEENA